MNVFDGPGPVSAVSCDGAERNKARPFHIWRHEVMCAAGVSWAECQPHLRRIFIWYRAGETIDGAAEMLRTFVDGSKKRLVRAPTRESLEAVGCKFGEMK